MKSYTSPDGEENPSFYGNSIFFTAFTISWSLIPLLSQKDPTHTFQSFFLKIHFKTINHLCLPLSSALFLLRRPTKTLYVDLLLSLVLAIFFTDFVPNDKSKFEVSEILRKSISIYGEELLVVSYWPLVVSYWLLVVSC